MNLPSRPLRAAPVTVVVVAVMSVMSLCVLMAAPSEARAPAKAPSDEASLELLARASEAAHATVYSGLQLVSAWSDEGATASLVNVAHVPGQGTEIRVVGTGATPETRWWAPDDQQSGGLAGLSAQQLDLLQANYTVVSAGADQVVGKEADVVEARRSDGSTAARFWVERRSRLLLRREILDTRGRVVHELVFLSLRLTSPSVTTPLATTARPPGGTPAPGTTLTPGEIDDLTHKGWPMRTALPSGLRLIDARRSTGSSGEVVHLTYSDGLAVVSVFLQRGRLDTGALRGWRTALIHGRRVYVRDSVQQRLTWAGAGYVITVLADAPVETVDGVVAAFPHEAEPGFWQRLARGLSRVVSWLNPFG